MPKIPDFSELTKKIDLHGIVDSLKSAISSSPVKPPEGDEITLKFAELTTLAQKLATVNAEQSHAITELYTKINHLAKEVQILSSLVSITKAASASPEEAHKQDNDKKNEDN